MVDTWELLFRLSYKRGSVFPQALKMAIPCTIAATVLKLMQLEEVTKDDIYIPIGYKDLAALSFCSFVLFVFLCLSFLFLFLLFGFPHPNTPK